MSLKCMVIGNITLDMVGETYRVGGPGYYGGRALKLLGCNVYLVTSISNKYYELFKKLYDWFQIIEYSCDRQTIFYISSGRATDLLEEGCRIPLDYLVDIVVKTRPDILVFSPVYREIGYEHIVSTSKHAGAIGLDIQGFTRRVLNGITNIWDDKLFEIAGYVSVVHGNIREYCFTDSFREIFNKLSKTAGKYDTYFQVSMDERGLYLVGPDKIIYYPPAVINVVDDIGAGDILLAVTTYYIGLGHNVEEATLYGLAAAVNKISSSNNTWFHIDDLEDFVENYRDKIVVFDNMS